MYSNRPRLVDTHASHAPTHASHAPLMQDTPPRMQATPTHVDVGAVYKDAGRCGGTQVLVEPNVANLDLVAWQRLYTVAQNTRAR